MNILIIGAKGFVGRKNQKGSNTTRPSMEPNPPRA